MLSFSVSYHDDGGSNHLWNVSQATWRYMPVDSECSTRLISPDICIVWDLAFLTLSVVSDIPELMVLQTKPRKDLRIETHLFTQCVPTWSDRSEMTFHVMKAVLLYTLPLIFMSVAYCQIVRVLWRSDNIPGHTESTNYYSTGSCNNGKWSWCCQSHVSVPCML
jgi:hypocretin (orexin) receptor 2